MRSEIDQRGIRSLYRDPGVGKELMKFARVARTHAQILAPYDTGAYQRSIKVKPGRYGRYVVAILQADDRKSYFIEVGSHDRHGGWQARNVLVRAVRRTGMRVSQVESRGLGAV